MSSDSYCGILPYRVRIYYRAPLVPPPPSPPPVASLSAAALVGFGLHYICRVLPEEPLPRRWKPRHFERKVRKQFFLSCWKHTAGILNARWGGEFI